MNTNIYWDIQICISVPLKSIFCCSLLAKHLENILRIIVEGNSWETNKQSIDKVRCAVEEKRPHNNLSRNSAAVNVKSLSNDDI